MKHNGQYKRMRAAAMQKLQNADPHRLSMLTGLHWNGTAFEAETLGISIRIFFPECRLVPEPRQQSVRNGWKKCLL